MAGVCLHDLQQPMWVGERRDFEASTFEHTLSHEKHHLVIVNVGHPLTEPGQGGVTGRRRRRGLRAGGGWQVDEKLASCTYGRLHDDGASVGGHDAVNDMHAQTRSLAAPPGGEEGLEQAGEGG